MQAPTIVGELGIMQPIYTPELAFVPDVGDGGEFQTFKKPSVYVPYVQYDSIESLAVYGSVEGVSSIYVNSHQYVLPIPKPLTAGDVWQSKLKSKWDKKIIFDGSADEEWMELGTNLVNKYRYALPLPLGVYADTSNNNAGSNNFPLLAGGQTGDGVRGFTITLYSGKITIVVYSDGGALESFRSYLAANPMSLWYQSTNYDGTNGLTVSVSDYSWGFVELDGTEKWAIYPWIANAFYCDNIAPGVFIDNAKKDFAICNSAQQNAYANVLVLANGEFAIGTPDNKIVRTAFKDTSCATVEAWKARLAENHVQVVYQLATPETYATDPVDIFTDDGEMWIYAGKPLPWLKGGVTAEVATNNIVLNGKTNDERAGEYGTPQVHTFP